MNDAVLIVSISVTYCDYNKYVDLLFCNCDMIFEFN